MKEDRSTVFSPVFLPPSSLIPHPWSSMFRRLLVCCGLPFVALALVLSLTVWGLVPDDQLRGDLLRVVGLTALACGAGLVVGCVWLSRQLARSVGELTRAVENI